MSSALLAHGTDVSSKTVKRRLTKDFGLKAFKPGKKTPPNSSNEIEEIKFCEETYQLVKRTVVKGDFFLMNHAFSNLDLESIQFGDLLESGSMKNTRNKL